MKVAVFLDYANINAAACNLNYNLDYGALLDYLADENEQRTLQVAYAYVPIDPRQEHAMDAEIENLWQKGYIVKSKVGAIAGESYKCDFDVEISMDISRVVYETSPDIVVLVSGDKDFVPIVLEIRGKGVRVEVAEFNSVMSRELALKSSGYIDLDFWINETVIVNGKRVNVPDSASSEDIINASGRRNVNPNTRAVIKNTNAASRDKLKPGYKYSINDGDKFSIVPDRVKAATYFGNKESWRKRVIKEQVIDVSAKMFKNSPVELDDDCNYVVFSGFLLPPEWQAANPGATFVKMMLIFPDQYPDLPTNGFYLPSTLQVPPNASHFYSRGYGGAFGEN